MTGILESVTCTCGKLRLNGPEVVGKNWSATCEEHGVNSEWYRTEGKAKHDAVRQRSVDMQMKAREARRKATQ